MQHSILNIGRQYEQISLLRKDPKPFAAQDFFEFSQNNQTKYSIIRNGADLFVSTWFCDALINDYRLLKYSTL